MKPSIELLESRIAPAAVVTFIDVDGDEGFIRTSKGSGASLLDAVKIAGAGMGQKITEIDLGKYAAEFEGTDLTVGVTKRGPFGDGKVHIGYIDASASNGSGVNDGAALSLGKVTISGDLGQIDATSVKALTVGSFGDFDNVQGANASAESTITGAVGTLKITGSMYNRTLTAGSIGTITVGGRVGGSTFDVAGDLGTATINGGVENSDILAFNLAKLTIKGGISGLGGSNVIIDDKLTSVTIVGPAVDARISATTIGTVLIKGDLVGGRNADFGSIKTGLGGIGKLTIQGSVIGSFGDRSGNITTTGRIGTAMISGSVLGGFADDTGVIRAGAGGIGKLMIGGSLAMPDVIDSYSVSNTALIHSEGDITTLKIGGDVRGATIEDSASNPTSTFFTNGAAIRAKGDIGSLTVLGSLYKPRLGGGPNFGSAGEITVGGTIGTLMVGGSIVGQSETRPWQIFATGPDAPTNGRFDAFGKIIVGGSVIFGVIGAGFARVEFGFGMDNADAGIGSAVIKGDFIGSDLGAGTSGGMDLFPAIVSRIGAITVGGTVVAGGGFAAEHIVSFKLGKNLLALTPGANNDNNRVPFANSAAFIDEVF